MRKASFCVVKGYVLEGKRRSFGECVVIQRFALADDFVSF